MVRITAVSEHSIARREGVLEGDILLSINGHPIKDVLDYRFYLTETFLVLSLLRGTEEIRISVRKHRYDDIGLDFETPLMDKKQSCANKCVFCFIDQMPKGMRESLYFKDDDSRLSFLHGNFITLTNLKDEDIDRIIKMHISPINISVHTTNPELRVRMMKNKRAGQVLTYLRKLADAGTTMGGQIVLCKGLNDGEELTRTMHDLFTLHPAMESVSIVPAGLTKYRDGLYHLEPYTKEECRAVIEQVDKFAKACEDYWGDRIFRCSDEFYLTAELPLPDPDFYGDYSQIENGVGMITSFKDEALSELQYQVDEGFKGPDRELSWGLITGLAAQALMEELALAVSRAFPQIHIRVHAVENRFFGPSITVTGLLTGQDMLAQLRGLVEGEHLLLSENTLRAQQDIFLDDMTPGELSEKLGAKISICPCDGMRFIDILLGLEEPLEPQPFVEL